MDSGHGNGDEPSANDEDDSATSLRDLADRVKDRRSRKGDGNSDFGTGAEVSSDSPVAEGPEAAVQRPIGEWGTDPKTEAIIEIIGDATNLLLLGPLHTPADNDLCTRLSIARPNELENLLLVTLTDSPQERLEVYQGYLESLPPQTQILSIGDSSGSGTREIVQVEDGGTVTIDPIADPTDLMRIGITISRVLGDWNPSDRNTSVCFHSLTDLLRFAPDQKTVFRFVHILRGRLQASGVHAHFHMDAESHDSSTISTFSPLFDDVLRFEPDGTLHVDR